MSPWVTRKERKTVWIDVGRRARFVRCTISWAAVEISRVNQAFVIKKVIFLRRKIPQLLQNTFRSLPNFYFPFNVNRGEKSVGATAHSPAWHISNPASRELSRQSCSLFSELSQRELWILSAQFQFSYSPGLKSHHLITKHPPNKTYILSFSVLFFSTEFKRKIEKKNSLSTSKSKVFVTKQENFFILIISSKKSSCFADNRIIFCRSFVFAVSYQRK